MEPLLRFSTGQAGLKYSQGAGCSFPCDPTPRPPGARSRCSCNDMVEGTSTTSRERRRRRGNVDAASALPRPRRRSLDLVDVPSTMSVAGGASSAPGGGGAVGATYRRKRVRDEERCDARASRAGRDTPRTSRTPLGAHHGHVADIGAGKFASDSGKILDGTSRTPLGQRPNLVGALH